MTSTENEQISVGELLKDAPRNWGKWGPDDEVGSLNYLTPEVVVQAAGVDQERQGLHAAGEDGQPRRRPGVARPQRRRAHDGHRRGPLHRPARASDFAGGAHYADDYMTLFLQGCTQYDALGHVWYDDQIWNGYDAKTTIGGLAKASVLPIAEKGVVGRGILLDIARWRGKDVLDVAETFTHEDLMACAKAQGAEIQKNDILIIRTGWIAKFYKVSREEFYGNFVEPGLTHSPELVQWFHDMEIPNLVTDTIANEVTVDPVSGVVLPLHNALMRNLGVTLTEIAWLDDLADDCAADGQYTFLYTAAPLKVVNGTGSPVNPVVIK